MKISITEVDGTLISFNVDNKTLQITIETLLTAAKKGYKDVYDALRATPEHSIGASVWTFLEEVLKSDEQSYETLTKLLPCSISKEFAKEFRKWLADFLESQVPEKVSAN